MDLQRDDEVPPELRPRGRKAGVFIGIGLMAAAGALVFLRLRGAEPATAPSVVAPQRGAELAPAQVTAPAAASPARPAGSVLDLDREPGPVRARATASGVPRATVKPNKAPKPARPAAASTSKRPREGDELDPGF